MVALRQFSWICLRSPSQSFIEAHIKMEWFSLVFSSFDQLWICDPLAVRSGEQRIDPIAFLGVAAIVARVNVTNCRMQCGAIVLMMRVPCWSSPTALK